MGKISKIRGTDTVEINVLKVADTETERVDALLLNAEYTCKDVGGAFDATYKVVIKSSDFEIVER